MTAFYNEIDPYAAAWLRNLIAAGHIAPGVVDERSIEDILPDELRAFTQVHFFAGVGVWSYALRRAGWPDDRPIWTGSCPCQPFSAAGKGGGFADERHLWPAFFHLITQCRPPIVVGEQVASKDGLGWLDLVSLDMESADYAFGAVDLCAAGVGVEWEESQAGEWLRRAIRDCPDPGIRADLCDFADWVSGGNITEGGEHIRQRLWWVGQSPGAAHGGDGQPTRPGASSGGLGHPDGQRQDAVGGIFQREEPEPSRGGRFVGLAFSDDAQRRPDATRGDQRDGEDAGRPQGSGDAQGRSGLVGLADAHHREQRDGRGTGSGDFAGDEPRPQPGGCGASGGLADAHGQGSGSGFRDSLSTGDGLPVASGGGGHGDPGPVNGFWRDADWLFCRDGKWRPVRPGTFPLAHGAPARVGRLRAYGNAINAQVAQTFIESLM